VSETRKLPFFFKNEKEQMRDESKNNNFVSKCFFLFRNKKKKM